MRLTKGNELSPAVREEVLRAFVHRWTRENSVANFGGRCPPWHEHHDPIVSDDEWITDHAFYVTNLGKLSCSHRSCEPEYMAE